MRPGVTDISDSPVAAPSTVGESAPELEQALFEVKRVIVGQDQLVERLLVALLADGHCLLEGVPGVAKTLAAQTLATAVGGNRSGGGNAPAVGRLVNAIPWLRAAAPGIYDALDVPLSPAVGKLSPRATT